MQQEPDHVAKLLSIQYNFLLGLKHQFFFFCLLAKGEKKLEEANKLKALCQVQEAIVKVFMFNE